MFERILQAAFDSGSEVIIQIKDFCCDSYQGRIQNLTDDGYFSLFHSGPKGGVLWTFKIADIAFCGQVIEIPSGIPRLESANMPLPQEFKPQD